MGGHVFSVDNTDLLPCATEAHLGDVDRLLKPSESQSLMTEDTYVGPQTISFFLGGRNSYWKYLLGISPFLLYFGDDFLGRMAQRSRGNGYCKRQMNNERTVVYKEHAVCQWVG